MSGTTYRAQARRHTWRIVPHLACALILPACVVFATNVSTADSIRIGVLAPYGKTVCVNQWQATAECLDASIPGTSFEIVPLNYDEAVDPAILPDLSFMIVNPAMYVLLERKHGASRIATRKTNVAGAAVTTFGGVLLCRSGEHAVTLPRDLAGKRIAAVHQDALGGWLAVWRDLLAMGFDPLKDAREVQWLQTNDAVLAAVADGSADFGIVRTGALEQMQAAGSFDPATVTVLLLDPAVGDPSGFPLYHSTRLYPEWPMVRLAHTDLRLAEQVSAALLQLRPGSPASQAAGIAGWTIPLNYEDVNQALRETHTAPYNHESRITVAEVIQEYGTILLLIVALLLGSVVAISVIVVLNGRLQKTILRLKSEKKVRERTETALSSSETRFQSIVENAHEGIAVLAGERILLHNDAFRNLFGGEDGPATFPDNLIDLIHEDDREAVQAVLDRAFDGQLPETPLYFRTDSGTEIEMSLTGMEYDTGWAVLGIARDITEAREVERRRQEAIQLTQDSARLASVGVLSAGITHEINQPLSAIQLSSDSVALWRDQNPDTLPPFVSELVDEISQGAARIGSIIEHMRSYWVHSAPAVTDIVDLNEAVKRALTLLTMQIRNHEIQLELNLSGTSLPVSGEQVQLEQIFSNLVANAIHALDEANTDDKRIRVFSGRDRGRCFVEITDTGPGLPTTDMDQLFDPFYSTRQPGKGMGLGLAIVKMFVERHRGTIQAVQNKGGGSTFRVTIPQATDSEKSDAHTVRG